MEGAEKHDDGKPRLELVDRVAMVELARVLGYGAEKYGADNWRKGLSQRRCLGAALRHIYDHLDGKDLDEESNLLHLAHAMAELMFAIRMHQTRPDLDDRYGKNGEKSDGKRETITAGEILRRNRQARNGVWARCGGTEPWRLFTPDRSTTIYE